MKILIITVAGTSSRFSQSLGKSCLKCIYYLSDIKESLLYRMLHQNTTFDKYIIVGGFLYEQLREIVKQEFSDLKDRIILVNNKHYAKYGSGYSLYKGLQTALTFDFDEIIFAEGDLYVDGDSFQKIFQSQKDVITCNRENILAEKAVAFYYDKLYGIHYIYDTNHNALEINEPFLGIFNSGQIWKFAQADRLRNTFAAIPEDDWHGTNLVLIQKYFQELTRAEYEIIQFQEWINCNTITDYKNMLLFE